MDAAGEDAIIEAMAKGGRIDSFVFSHALEVMLGRGLETHGPHLAAIAHALQGRDAVDTASAARAEHGTLSVFSPDTGDPWRLALRIDSPAGRFLVGIVLSGRPDPAFDKIFRELTGRRPAAAERRRTPDPSRVTSVSFYGIAPGTDPGRVLRDFLDEAWRSDLLIDRRSSSPPYGENDSWIEGSGRLNHEGADRWQAAFATLRDVISTFGDPARIAADAAAFGERRFHVHGDKAPQLRHYDAAEAFAGAASRADDYLPAANAAAAMTRLTEAALARDADRLIGAIETVHASCIRAGLTEPGREHEFDDMDSHVHATAENGTRKLFLRDDNGHHEATLETDGGGWRLSVVSSKGAEDDAERYPAVEVARSGDRTVARIQPGFGAPRMRAWNGFVSLVEGAELTLAEEYGATPTP